MKKKKICVVMTARGNYAKLRSVIREIKKRESLDLIVIVGGSLTLEKYGKILEDEIVDDFNIDHTVHFLVEGESPYTMAKSAGLAVTDFANAFQNFSPDIVVVLADRYESLAIAMAASYMNIGLAHIEGGEVSGSVDESIRHAITKLSHVHFPASADARNRIIRMGEKEEFVFNVGSTSFDIFGEIPLDDLSFFNSYQKTHGVGALINIDERNFIIVIKHPVTTEYENNYDNTVELTTAIDLLEVPTLWIWPNMDAGSDGVSKAIRVYREQVKPKHVRFFKSLPIEYFAPLLSQASCIVGNSSAGIREASYLGTPCINIGSRQEGRERSKNILDVDCNTSQIVDAVKKQIRHGRYGGDKRFGRGDSARQIVEVLENFSLKQQKKIAY